VSEHQAASPQKRVAVIGGLTRSTLDWERVGASLGVVVEHHDGDTTGQRATALASTVRRADVVIAILMPNSHNAVAIARRISAEHGQAFVLVKRLSPNTLGPVVADALALSRAVELAR
jgi:hypothetical protein